MELEATQSYANFRAWCPRKEVSIGGWHPISWRYYDWGPKAYPEPVICLHSLIGSAESFYQQIIALAPRGYRVISIQIPVYWTVDEFCGAFNLFLETIPHQRIHLYGAGLGGFLAMHYAVRKPDSVASLVLTHSFLATENLNLRIPYSAAVLRWLPDFLVRGTMRAILPKGRVSLDMANAAELAIGQTLSCSREVLASRMALSVTSSSVVKRIHIPETSITLIDTLDRLQPALELSELTASQLPNARRALLKTGGDFPYLSVPEDVNVHLIVHLRRNGVDPVADVPVPVPARPRMLPEAVRRRRLDSSQAENSEVSNEQTGGGEGKCKKLRRTPEERLKAARGLVAADERSRIEKFTFEIGQLREFLPTRNDAYLAAVLENCEGNLEMAISNALEGQYNDEFYEAILKEAIARAMESIQREEEEDAPDEDQEEGETANDSKPEESHNVEAVDENEEMPDFLKESGDHDRDVAALKRRATLDQDPLAGAEFYLKDENLLTTEQENLASKEREAISTRNEGVVTSSPETRTSEQDTLSTDAEEDDPLRSRSHSAMSSVDLNVTERFAGVGNGEISPTARVSSSEGGNSEKLDSGVSRKHRRSRRRSYPQGADAVEAYVSSEKVGMRSRGPLVGRGPAPFNNVIMESGLSPGEAWMRTPRLREEDEMQDDSTPPPPLPSAASLLEASGNPLDLPGHETQYPERTRARTPSLERRYTQGSRSHSRSSTPTFSSWQPRPLTQDTGILVPEEETLLGTAAAITETAPPAPSDEWELYRRPERGLAAVIPSPERYGEDDKTVQAHDLSVEGEIEGEGDDSARLREWRMSAAQAASKNVHR